jgi:dynein heavy chain
LSDRFITDGDKEWFDVELTNTLEKELGEEAAEIIKEPRYFVDFMRDAPEPTGEEVC